MVGKQLLAKRPDDSVYTLRAKSFIKISLSNTIFEVNAFLHFMKNFKMADKIAGNQFLAKSAR